MLKWGPQYELGIKSIDDQHRRWVDILNELSSSLESKPKVDLVKEGLRNILAYADYHFSHEELLYKEVGYLDAPAHDQIHRTFKAKILKYLFQLGEGKEVFVSELMQEMKDWLVHHICEEDKKYVDLLKSRGVI